MEFSKDGKLKVGNTTFSSLFQIRIPEYGYELPEINSSSPIIMPMFNSVANIINWLERGIYVEFHDKKDAEKIFFFIMEYNRFAEGENKKIDNIDDQYNIAANAQMRLFKIIDYKHYVEKMKADEEIPFKHNPFKGIKKHSDKEQISSSYKNPFVKRVKQGIKKKQQLNLPVPDDIFAYDLFKPSPDMNIVEADIYKDIDFN
jgi:hypothetical protein